MMLKTCNSVLKYIKQSGSMSRSYFQTIERRD